MSQTAFNRILQFLSGRHAARISSGEMVTLYQMIRPAGTSCNPWQAVWIERAGECELCRLMDYDREGPLSGPFFWT